MRVVRDGLVAGDPARELLDARRGRASGASMLVVMVLLSVGGTPVAPSRTTFEALARTPLSRATHAAGAVTARVTAIARDTLRRMTDLDRRLGTVLTVWAHPDDETYLAGGLLAPRCATPGTAWSA